MTSALSWFLRVTVGRRAYYQVSPCFRSPGGLRTSGLASGAGRRGGFEREHHALPSSGRLRFAWSFEHLHGTFLEENSKATGPGASSRPRPRHSGRLSPCCPALVSAVTGFPQGERSTLLYPRVWGGAGLSPNPKLAGLPPGTSSKASAEFPGKKGQHTSDRRPELSRGQGGRLLPECCVTQSPRSGRRRDHG